MPNGLAELEPLRSWLKRDPIEDLYSVELRSVLIRARAEFRGSTEEEVGGLWSGLRHAMLASYRRLGKPAPTYRQEFTISDDPEPETMHYGLGHERTSIDFVAAVEELYRSRSPHARPFREFLSELDRDRSLALARCLALVTMHEARDRNPAGALRAANLLRVVDAHLRPRLNDAAVIAQGRRRGGLKTGLQRRQMTLLRHNQAWRIWKSCKEARNSRPETVRCIADRCNVALDTARRWIANFERGKGSQPLGGARFSRKIRR